MLLSCMITTLEVILVPFWLFCLRSTFVRSVRVWLGITVPLNCRSDSFVLRWIRLRLLPRLVVAFWMPRFTLPLRYICCRYRLFRCSYIRSGYVTCVGCSTVATWRNYAVRYPFTALPAPALPGFVACRTRFTFCCVAPPAVAALFYRQTRSICRSVPPFLPLRLPLRFNTRSLPACWISGCCCHAVSRGTNGSMRHATTLLPQRLAVGCGHDAVVCRLVCGKLALPAFRHTPVLPAFFAFAPDGSQ